MEHNDARHKLSEYLDGSSTAEERAAIEAHLMTCSACSDALLELQKTVEHIKSVEEVEPPAWTTQKITAKVRAGAGAKKSPLRRFFFPLSIKLPISAVAVLFLTVAAFYFYRNMQPTPAPSEVPQAAAPAKEQTISPEPTARSKKVPQSPEHKSLDMKYEYEKPAPPVALGKAAESAPAPAPQARTMSTADVPKKIKLSLSAPDATRAVQDIENIVTRLGGRVLEKTGDADMPAITASLDSGKLKELNARLRPVGELKDKEILLLDHHGTLQIEIVILKTAPRR